MKNKFDSDIKALSKLSPLRRIVYIFSHKSLRFSGVSVLISAIALLTMLLKDIEALEITIKGLISIIISPANAQASPIQEPELKSYFIGGMMLLLMFLFIWALLTLTFSKQTKALTVATEAVKTLMGFFIGTLTGFSAK